MVDPQHREIRIAIPRDIDSDLLFERASKPGSLSLLEGETMGTYWKLHYVCPPTCSDEEVCEWIQTEFTLVVRQMSHYDEGSELSLLNAAPAGEWRTISPEFFFVLKRALEVAAETEGRYDPSVGQLVRRQGFGPELLPSEADTAHLGWHAVELDSSRSAVRHQGGCHLDLSSIAKGYALDRVGECLEGEGIWNYLLEVGGEFRGAGVKPSGQPWWVDLDPLSGRTSGLSLTRVALIGFSLATSGTAIQSRLVGGRLTHHLIDPQGGVPVQSTLQAVSVLAPTCLEADAWATALFILGPEEGLAFAEKAGLAATFVTEAADQVAEFASSSFSALLED